MDPSKPVTPDTKIETHPLEGAAAAYLDNRDYVHGSSLIEHLDEFFAGRDETLNSIRFAQPLKNMGILILGAVEDLHFTAESLICSSGTFQNSSSNQRKFAIIDSQIAITERKSSTEKETQWRCTLDREARSVSINLESSTHPIGQIVFAMKLLCSQTVSEEAKWWFGSMEKSVRIDQTDTSVSVKLTRNTLNRYVIGEIATNAQTIGKITFMSGAPNGQ